MPGGLESDDRKVRNRQNQQRSRQRQKEYISSLEAKLAEHQRSGAQASKVLQDVARRVAEENHKLRELLVAAGISKMEVDAYVNGSQSPIFSDSPRPVRPQLSSLDVTTAGNATPVLSCSNEPETHSAVEDSEACSATTPPTLADERLGQDIPQEPVVIVQQNETDCEHAARIIAGMRGGGDSDDVWTELGCGFGGKCSVKNSRLFDLMDQR